MNDFLPAGFRAVSSASALVLALSMAASQEVSAGQMVLKEVASGFVAPVGYVAMPEKGVSVVVDQIGVAYLVGADGKANMEKPFLDVRSKMTKLNAGFDERGLLSVVLHPEYATNKKIYACYSAPLRNKELAEWDHTMNISEFTSDGASASVDSEKIILQIDKPWFNHNGGALAFGPDKMLYIAVGDGGNAHDTGRGHPPMGNGQDLTTLLGKILRIDVNKGTPYTAPADNPFKAGQAKPEIFAYGLRNPWRMSFDRGGKHQLFAADVGQDLYEEVDIIEKGGNYGWNKREGFHGFDPATPKASPTNSPTKGADGKPFVSPILEYKNMRGFPKDTNAVGISITGGYVYRGKALPELTGKYVFADWSANWVKGMGVLMAATPNSGSGAWDMQRLDIKDAKAGAINGYILSFGEDNDGELYVLTTTINGLSGKTGKVWKLAAE